MANDTYTANADGSCYVGMFSRPSWALDIAEGEFKNISSINTVQDIFLAQYPDVLQSAQPFTNWSGGVLAHGLGEIGSYAVLGSGHLNDGATYCSGVAVFDLSTLTWYLRAYSENPVIAGALVNEFGETTDPLTAPYPLVPHTYQGLIYQPESAGGGINGSIIQNWYAGVTWAGKFCAHAYSLSPSNPVPIRISDSINPGGTLSGYPASALDTSRNGYWIMRNNGNTALNFVSFDGYSVTTFNNIDYPARGNGNLVYIPAPYDCLVMLGSRTSAVFTVWVSKIIDGVPNRFLDINIGSSFDGYHNDYGSGGVWSELLSCIVSYPARGAYNVVKIIPPSDVSLIQTAGEWRLESEFLTGKDGVVPSDSGKTTDAAWSRFIEHKPSRTFIWCDKWDQPVQAWRLTGMA